MFESSVTSSTVLVARPSEKVAGRSMRLNFLSSLRNAAALFRMSKNETVV